MCSWPESGMLRLARTPGIVCSQGGAPAPPSLTRVASRRRRTGLPPTHLNRRRLAWLLTSAAGGPRGKHSSEPQKRGEVFQPRSVVRRRSDLRCFCLTSEVAAHCCAHPAEGDADPLTVCHQRVGDTPGSLTPLCWNLLVAKPARKVNDNHACAAPRGSTALEQAAGEYVSRIKNYTSFEEVGRNARTPRSARVLPGHTPRPRGSALL